MEQLPSNLVKTAALKGGAGRPTNVAGPAVKKETDSSQASDLTQRQESPTTSRENGVTSTTTPEGFLSQTSDTGVSVLRTDKGQEIALPSGQKFELSEQGVRSLDDQNARGATLTRTGEGLLLVSFQDQDGNTVQVDPESLTYEVMNKQKNLSQVFLPDGHQQVVAFGQFHDRESGKISKYQHEVLLDPKGEVIANNGFEDFGVEGKKLSFKMGNTRIERSLIKPLPGQPAFEPAPAAGDATASSNAINPLSIFGEQPVLGAAKVDLGAAAGLGAGSVLSAVAANGTVADLTPPAGSDAPAAPAPVESPATPAETVAAPVGPDALAGEADVQAQQDAAQLAEFQALPDIGANFFAGADEEGVSFDQTVSGLIMRSQGNSRAYLLPNGDSFRTDGKHIEVLGDNPRADKVRIVDEGDSQLLAYSDPEGNNHQLNINNGDYSVSNRQGTLTQGVRADGTREYIARGTYTSEAGSPVQYAHQASFGANGALLSKEGFDDLRISGSDMVFTLPNGVQTDRKLLQDAGHEAIIPKKLVVSGGFADEWGAGLALADELMAGHLPAGGGVQAGAVPAASAPLNAAEVAAGQAPRAPGLVRQPLPGGGAVSTLPNGIRFFDAPQGLSAVDPMGNPLPVQKSVLASETGESYLMSVTGPDGAGYTIANNTNDIIVQSADGKVHQLVRETGSVFTSILDNGNQHLVEKDPFKGITCSPGTRLDPRFPDRVFVDGPTGSYHYQVPHPFAPLPPNGELPPEGRIPGAGPAAPGGPTPAAEGLGDPLSDARDPSWQDQGYHNDRGFMAGPGGTAPGMRPNFWQRLKGAFTGDNPWDPGLRTDSAFDQRQMYGGSPYSGHYPGSYQQFDPMAAQWAQFNQQMMMSTMAMQSMSMMNMMFFSPMGMFW